MFHYKRDIFDFFPNKSILLRFCDKINQCDADVYIVMAHKAVQLFQVLLDQGHIHKHIGRKIIISSQALDYDCDYLLHKKIAIIDDIVISGTSIASAIHKLVSAGINADDNIEIIALARDKDYQTMVFDDDKGNAILHCDTLLGDAACIELSYFISQAFSYYGIPYDVDYPTYNVTLGNDKEQFLFKELFWRTETTTNIDQQIGDVSSYVLFPKECIFKMLWSKLGADLSMCTHIKIRAYVRRYPSGRTDCTIVPMCLFNEIAERDLDKLYRIFSATPAGNAIDMNVSYIAQMHYLEFYIAHQMYLVFNELTTLDEHPMPTDLSIKLLFGDHYGAQVSAFLGKKQSTPKHYLSIESVNYIDKDLLKEFFAHEIGIEMARNIAKVQQLDLEEQGEWINHIILAPFLWWYDTKEIPVRRQLMSPAIHYMRDFVIIENKLARLRCGFSLNTLQYILCGSTADQEAEILISMFLDHAIDQGIIVPTVFHNTSKHYLCRAYRHGEDLPFSLEDECRLAFFLQRISQKIASVNHTPIQEVMDEGFSEIAFEKIIVLFYQMGLRQGGIFNHFLGFNNIKILKPFLSLHGAIQAFVDPEEMKHLGIEKTHFYSEKDASGNKYITWLTHWAKDQGFAWNSLEKDSEKKSEVFLNGDKIRLYLEKHERSCINSTIANRINAIADIIAVWYNDSIKKGKRPQFKEDATALTSCPNAFIFLSAIATELHYFKKFWNNQVKKAMENAADYREIEFELKHKDSNDRKNALNIIQGLNSGRDKVKWYNANSAKTVVDSVSCILQGSDAGYWSDIWETVKITPEPTDRSTSKYIDQAIGFLYFYSACNDCLTYGPFWQTGEKPPYYDEYRKEFDGRRGAFQGGISAKCFDKLDSISQLKNYDQKKERFAALVQSNLSESDDLVNNVECEIERKDPDYSMEYVSSLIFEVDAFNPNHIESKIMEVWKQQKDLTKKTELNIIRFPDALNMSGYKRYGVFYGISQNYSGSLYTEEEDYADHGAVLLSLYRELCQQFNCQVNSIRAILIPQLPVGRRYKQNTQNNMIEYANIFLERVVQKLEHMYVPGASNQLVLAMTESVNQKVMNSIQEVGWGFSKEGKSEDFGGGFSRVVTFYNVPHSPDSSNDTSRIFFSTVMIECENNFGMGLLVKSSNRIVCVTCNHIIKNYDTDKPIVAYSDHSVSFSLKPITEIHTVNDSPGLNPAERELAILEPLWDIQIPLDVKSIISINNLSTDLDQYINQPCQCCCCTRIGQRHWLSPINLIGLTDHGYYQMKDIQKHLKSGSSGGVMILTGDQGTIIGIHKGRIFINEENEYDSHLIPSSLIRTKILQLEETKNEQNN